MDYLYKKPKKTQSSVDSLRQNEIIVPIVEQRQSLPSLVPATIITHEIPKPEAQSDTAKGCLEPEVKQLGHITFISQEEYLRDIETMCKRDKWFMETVRGFCNKVVDVGAECVAPRGGLEQPIQSDKSTSISGEGSE